MKKILTILIGLPASGKSTWRDRLDAGAQLVLSTDDMIEDAAKFFDTTYDAVFKTVIDTANKIYEESFTDALNAGVPIVLDRTNLSRKTRQQFIRRAKNKGYEVHAVNFARPETTAAHDEWNRRLSSRPGKTIPDFVLVDMFYNYTTGTLDEGFDIIQTVDTFHVG